MKKKNLDALNRMTIEDYKNAKKHNIIIVLDNIRSALNVGSFFRTADAFACEQIVLTGISAQPPHPELNKTAIGADRSVSWTYSEHVLDAIKVLKNNNIFVVGVEQTDQSIFLHEAIYQKHQKIALVFGNEVNGLSEDILSLLDMVVEVPQYGTKHSLNVAVCGGVVIWDVLQKIN